MKRLLVPLPLLLTLLSAVALLLHGPIAQLPHYHDFADTRSLFGLPNAADVLSNAGFALTGLWGLARLWPYRRHSELAAGWPGYCLFLAALILTSVGSSYYHLAPDNARLAWDRLPIALACAGLLVGVRAENGPGINAPLWAGLLGAGGALSVWWWYFTDQAGHGDLRFYLLLQLLPLVLIPLWHAIYRAPGKARVAFGAAAALYGIAKAAELSDHSLFTNLGWISGHTIKHLMAALAAGILVNHLAKRVDAASCRASDTLVEKSRIRGIGPSLSDSPRLCRIGLPLARPAPEQPGSRTHDEHWASYAPMTTDNKHTVPASGNIVHLRRSFIYGGLLWALTILFSIRVLGQLVQRWFPQPYLPSFESFQGSGLPYWILLSAQAVILAAMARYSWRVGTSGLMPRYLVGRRLGWLGGIYMLGSLGRIIIGIAIPSAPAWFSTWIAAEFHVVLAGYVLVLASYHRQAAPVAAS